MQLRGCAGRRSPRAEERRTIAAPRRGRGKPSTGLQTLIHGRSCAWRDSTCVISPLRHPPHNIAYDSTITVRYLHFLSSPPEFRLPSNWAWGRGGDDENEKEEARRQGRQHRHALPRTAHRRSAGRLARTSPSDVRRAVLCRVWRGRRALRGRQGDTLIHHRLTPSISGPGPLLIGRRPWPEKFFSAGSARGWL
jgi:hypothetical protein